MIRPEPVIRLVRRTRLSRALRLFCGSALCAMLICSRPTAWSQGASASAPDDVQALSSEATAAQQRGDLPAAIGLYRQAVTIDPGWPEGWWLLGRLEYSTDQYEQARASLTHYLELAPNAAAALALRGLCEYEIGAYEVSLHDVQSAIALGAANDQRNGQILLYHQALLLTRLGRFEEAIAKYTLFIKQGLVNPDVATGIALAGLRMPVLPQAVDAAEATLLSETGQAAVEAITGDPAEARKRFAAVLTAFPDRPFVHYFCGYLLFTAHPDLAVEEFKLELAVNPSNSLAHAMLAWSSELRGEYAVALPEAEAAAAADPGSPITQLVLGRALVESTNLDGAIAHLSQVVASDPSNLEAHLSLAKAYSKLGRKEDAQRERTLCLKLAGEGMSANANR